MLSEKEKSAVRVEVQGILTRFARALETAKGTSAQSSLQGSLRIPSGGSSDPDFRKRIFANAPKKTKDCIVAEKARW